MWLLHISISSYLFFFYREMYSSDTSRNPVHTLHTKALPYFRIQRSNIIVVGLNKTLSPVVRELTLILCQVYGINQHSYS